MESKNLIICELKGSVDSNPEILSSYPIKIKSAKLIPKFLPYASKSGDSLTSKLGKDQVITYVFSISHQGERDDLLSISLIIQGRRGAEEYIELLRHIIDTLERYDLLTEEILKTELPAIYEGINKESSIRINSLVINCAQIFENINLKHTKAKPKLKGSFF
jgi:hypothetical protein